MGLNLLRIQAFLAVAESRNISRAAAQLEVAQSVVSRHLRALEDELGCRLFARTGRGVTPTDAAERLAPRLRTAIEDMERATREASDAAEQPSGVVRLGVIPAAARPLVGLLYQRVSQRWPRLSLQFVESFSNTLDDELAAGALDIAVVNRFGRRLRPGEEPLVTVPSHVIGPPGVFEGTAREISLKGLARLPLVLAARPNGLRVELDHLCRHHGLSLQVAVESNSLLVMKDLMVQGACTRCCRCRPSTRSCATACSMPPSSCDRACPARWR